ncbi:MAG: crossover junction endodeoxyribonuclease RuvC [Gemmataceae bacterium]|nr:crossover junction endodeoxyribonuclease RuvC [Gemmataceae bacterium]
MVRVLGIDPGLRVTGYGLVDVSPRRLSVCEAGVIRTDKARDGLSESLLAMYQGVAELLDQFQPAAVAVEQLYAHYQHPRTAILMGHARGAILLAAAQRRVSVVSYSATRIKKTITGSGRASKEQMQRTIQRELGLAQVPEPPDVADALAVALCHCYAHRGRL